jgi:lysophospholipase L1-like esterase
MFIMNLKTVGKIAIGVGAVFILYSFIIKKKVKNRNILFVGDSMTTIRDKDGNENSAFQTYPNLIKKMNIPNINIDVLAIGGKTTQWMKEELPKQLDLKNYDEVYIFGGTNDIFRGVPIKDVVSNVQEMVNLINQKNIKSNVIVGSDTKEAWEENLLNPKQWGLKTKDDILNVKKTYIDYQDNLNKNIKDSNLITINMGKGTTYDGVHPNLQGNKMIAETITDVIKRGL